MSYSPEMQAKIDAEAAAQRVSGPSFPMPRLRHNGETGEWSIREVEGEKLAETVSKFEALDGKWGGIVLRVTYMAQSKYKKDVPWQKMTREFTDFKTEPIELLKRTFGENGKTEAIKIYPNYQAFKEGTALKDEDGNAIGSAYDLKACLYVYHLSRKQVIKLVCGGSARSEWFEYERAKPSGDPGILSMPWRMVEPSARLLKQVKTVFSTTPSKTDKGMEYHRLSFAAHGVCTEEELMEVWAVQDKLNIWVDAWKQVHANKQMEKEVPIEKINDYVPTYVEPMPLAVAAGIPETGRAHEDDEINLSDIPF